MAHLLSKNGHLVSKNGHLVRVTDPNDCDCCGPPPVPSNCNNYTLERARACASDWQAAYPADSDHAAFVASLTGTSVDVTLPTGFANDSPPGCPGSICTGLSGATFNLPHFGGTVWRLQINNYCSANQFILVFSISCPGSGVSCDLQVTLVLGGSFGTLNPIWKKTTASQITFATLNESIPRFNSNTGVGSGSCNLTNITDPVQVVLH